MSIIPQILTFATLSVALSAQAAPSTPVHAFLPPLTGLVLTCKNANMHNLIPQLQGFLHTHGLPSPYTKITATSNTLSATLTYPTSTTKLHESPYFRHNPEVLLHKPGTGMVPVSSITEILAAMLSPGRTSTVDLTTSSGQCSFDELEEHLAIRQNITLWSTALSWVFPDGGPAKWNTNFWNKGTPLQSTTAFTVAAFADPFLNPKSYEIGCYTATKLVIAQAFLDYYSRLNPNPRKLEKVVQLLWSDKDPLVDIEPYGFWAFEDDHDTSLPQGPGKLMAESHSIAPNHFIPGDWSYFLNPDAISYAKAGYEGSNAIYLGRNRFDDYYADTERGYYTYEQKLDEVYQWRHGVFSRRNHAHLIQPLTSEQLQQLALPPSQQGLVLTTRLIPIQVK